MSEYILCKGNKPSTINEKIQICDLDDFLREKAIAIWGSDNSVWTLMFDGHEIDELLTNAQDSINSGRSSFENTAFYKAMAELLDCDISIAMWYDLNCYDLKRCNSKAQALDICFKGITDEYGLCEIYLITE